MCVTTVSTLCSSSPERWKVSVATAPCGSSHSWRSVSSGATDVCRRCRPATQRLVVTLPREWPRRMSRRPFVTVSPLSGYASETRRGPARIQVSNTFSSCRICVRDPRQGGKLSCQQSRSCISGAARTFKSRARPAAVRSSRGTCMASIASSFWRVRGSENVRACTAHPSARTAHHWSRRLLVFPVASRELSLGARPLQPHE